MVFAFLRKTRDLEDQNYVEYVIWTAVPFDSLHCGHELSIRTSKLRLGALRDAVVVALIREVYTLRHLKCHCSGVQDKTYSRRRAERIFLIVLQSVDCGTTDSGGHRLVFGAMMPYSSMVPYTFEAHTTLSRSPREVCSRQYAERIMLFSLCLFS